MSLYMDTGVVERHRQELAGLSVGKSCIRFRRIQDLPLDAIRRMLEESVGSRQAKHDGSHTTARMREMHR
jgi:hypothetical protein